MANNKQYYLVYIGYSSRVHYRHSKCHKFYTNMISSEKEFTPKCAFIMLRLKLQPITVNSKVYTKIYNFIKIRLKYTLNTVIKH